MKQQFYGVGEFARLLSVTPARVWQIIKEGKIDAQKIGGKVWVIDKESAEKYLKARNVIKGKT
jgi:excisionase family DNA binding protein